MADLTITAANVAVGGSATKETGVAGEAITAGEVLLKNSSNEMVLADADDVSLDEVYGIALNDAASGQPIVYAKPGSDITIGATLTAGTAYFLSATAGAICPHADLVTDDRVIFLGIAISTSVLRFRPIDSGVILS